MTNPYELLYIRTYALQYYLHETYTIQCEHACNYYSVKSEYQHSILHQDLGPKVRASNKVLHTGRYPGLPANRACQLKQDAFGALHVWLVLAGDDSRPYVHQGRCTCAKVAARLSFTQVFGVEKRLTPILHWTAHPAPVALLQSGRMHLQVPHSV